VYDGGQAPGGVHAIGSSLAEEFGLAPFAAYNNVLPDATALSLTGAGAALDLSGFSETIGSLEGVADTEVILGGATSGATLTFGGNNTSTAFAGKITGPGGIVKTGTGAFDLNGTGANASAFDGPTVVSGGKFRVNGELSGTSSVQVSSGASLGGNGTITTANGNVVLAAGAKLEPGLTAGTLTLALGTGVLDVSAAVGLDGSGALVFELGSVANADLARLTTGQLSIGLGGLEFDDFTFATLAGFQAGTYTLFDTTAPLLGTLGSDLTGTIGGLDAMLLLSANNQDVLLTVVPEPSSVAMLLGGMLILARRRRCS
jgi:autotransporter-associated beta strand protein